MREAVLKRDNYTCQVCERKNIELHTHHIKPFKYYPADRLKLSNGLTLCKDCHNITNGRYRKKEIWTREKIKDIIKKTFES